VINSGSISMMKAMGFAGTAVDAIFATRLAANGFTGPTGTLAWFAARANPAQTDVAVDLDPASYRLPKVAFKRFPIQIELAAIVEAGTKLSPRVRDRASHIQSIAVGTYPGIIDRVADSPKFQPKTRGTADHSLPVCLAMALLDGDLTLAQFEKDRWRAPDVTDLVQKTTVRPSSELMTKLPNGRGASMEIVFSDGATLREVVDVPEGDARRPLSSASLRSKFMAAAVPVLGVAQSQTLLAQANALETLADLTNLARSMGERV
jgi:2-methylcitrate dehydratase